MNQVQRQLAIGTIAVVVLTGATVLQTPSVETELQAATHAPALGFASLGAIGSTVTAVQSMFESVPPRHWQEQIDHQSVQTTVDRHGTHNVSVALSRSQYRVQFNGIQPDWDRTPTVTSRRGFNGMHDFVWVDSNNFSDTERYDARITLPDTYDRVYRCEGTADDPDCFTLDRYQQGMERPYYRVVDGETVVYMNLFSGAGGTQTQILKPTDHTDEGGRSGNLGNAYDNTGEYDESTRSTTEVGRGHDPSVRFNTWDTTDKQEYNQLSLSVTMELPEDTGGDEWGFFYTTDGTSCDSTDNAVVARTSDSPSSPTNYTTLISADQDLSQLEVCITEWDNGGDAPDLWTYDIRTNGTYTLETPPFWRNQQQNVSTIKTGGAVELAAQGNDADGLDHAVLATDETGTWENKTGSYGSPMSLGTTNEWTWSNFTWTNSSITDQTVQWKIYYNNTDGNWSVTDTLSFTVDSTGAGGTQIQILKPTAHTDENGETTGPGNAYDNAGYDESSSSATKVDRDADPAIRFNQWNTTGKQDYTDLSLTVAVRTSNDVSPHPWSLYYDSSGGSCSSADNVLKSHTDTTLNTVTNYTVSLPADQPLSDLELCLRTEQNGDRNHETVDIYDIFTNGTYTLATPPLWQNQQQNVSEPSAGDPVKLAAQGNDSDGLDYAVLSTDESGSWMNQTGSYGSPMSLGTTNEWTWSNFTWTNSSITDQTVQWKIYYNDTNGDWNGTDSLSFTIDSTAPTITIHDPTGIVGTDTPWLNVTADEAVDTWLYNVDGGSNSTFAPNITLSGLTEGDHTVNVYANDPANNVGKTSQSFTVDTTPPALDYNPSATGSGTHTQNWIFVNVTATDAASGLDFVRETFDGTNSTVATNSGDHWWENHTGLSDGSYTVQAWANDSAGHYRFTSERSITLDTTPPTTTDNWTVSGWQSQSSAFIELTSSDSTMSVDRISYRVDGGTWTTSTGSSTTLTISGDGNHTLEYNATDMAGNQETTQIEYVALDTTAPTVTIHSPENTTYTEDSVPLEVTANEKVETWTYSLDAGSNITFTPNTTLSGLSDGQHDVVVSANDSVGNTGSARHVFTVDTTPATWIKLVEQTQDTFRKERNVPDEPSGWSKWN